MNAPDAPDFQDYTVPYQTTVHRGWTPAQCAEWNGRKLYVVFTHWYAWRADRPSR